MSKCVPSHQLDGLKTEELPAVTAKVEHLASDLELIFNACFKRAYNTTLIGGADEPLYQPQTDTRKPHCIFYRHDYFASALHEIAHWCIAGKKRRLLEDYGYWYSEDGRDAVQQAAFEKVEIKPQAIEWAFSKACHKPFRVSIDNLNAGEIDDTQFKNAVAFQLSLYQASGFPPRAAAFILALQKFYRVSNTANTHLDLGGVKEQQFNE